MAIFITSIVNDLVIKTDRCRWRLVGRGGRLQTVSAAPILARENVEIEMFLIKYDSLVVCNVRLPLGPGPSLG